VPIYNRYTFILLLAVLAVLVWSGIAPKDRLTWWLEVFPALIGLVVLFALRNRFRFTPLVQTFIALHMILLAVGGHYTYGKCRSEIGRAISFTSAAITTTGSAISRKVSCPPSLRAKSSSAGAL
jgi:uncharacterized membrane protein YjdF